jgi:hypothetical protein
MAIAPDVDCSGSAENCWAGAYRAVPSALESQVHDVLFVLLTIVVFAILALIAKGAEKL